MFLGLERRKNRETREKGFASDNKVETLEFELVWFISYRLFFCLVSLSDATHPGTEVNPV